MTDTVYDIAYRKAYPKTFPCSPWERQPELRDRFKRIVDAALSEDSVKEASNNG